MQQLLITNARIVTAHEVLRGGVMLAGGRFEALASGSSAVPAAEDWDGDFLVPGLVELHTDNLERHLMPRPRVHWPARAALFAHDAEIAAAGITTVFDALGVGGLDEDGLRVRGMAHALEAIDAAVASGLLRVEHRIHVRCEVPAENTLELFRPFERHPLVGLVSVMDHTPGQRQWVDIAKYRIYNQGKKGWSDAQIERAIARAREQQETYAVRHRQFFIDYCRDRRVPLASHDDTTPAHVDEAAAAGVSIAEFPTQVVAAARARALGMTTVMGAPNLVRGGSHSGNVAALDLARDGLLDALSSDYVPASLLHAAFLLERNAGFTLPRAIATVTRNPARAVGLDDRGEIAPGQRADFLRVRLIEGYPVMRAAWREGVRIA